MSATAWNEAIRGMPESEQLISLAIGIVQNRINSLPEDDRNELFELLSEIPKAPDGEERNSIWTAMWEILAQRPIAVHQMPLAGINAISGKPKKWAEHIGKKVRELRNEQGWTQTDLATKTGLPQSHISRIEKAEYSATHKTLDKIAKAFGIDVGAIDPSLDESPLANSPTVL